LTNDTLNNITLNNITLNNITLNNITLNNITLNNITLNNITATGGISINIFRPVIVQPEYSTIDTSNNIISANNALINIILSIFNYTDFNTITYLKYLCRQYISKGLFRNRLI